MSFAIDGLFLTQNITGIQRYAYEICKELDKIVDRSEIEIIVPDNTEISNVFDNLNIVKYGKHHGRLWQQLDLPKYIKANNKTGIFLTNEVPMILDKGIVCLHDISYKTNPDYFKEKKDRISAIWHRFNYLFATRPSYKIITVSDFSRNEISRVFKRNKKDIEVINNSWQHINKINETTDFFEKYSYLKKDNYYFSMSTLAANKNFKWILFAARQNPDKEFAIAGGGKLKGAAEAMGFIDLPNIHFLGYVSDEDAKALMHYCKAFLFPTLYEGFGIPPLEAIASGCKQIIVSDIPCMHEIYGEYANYIDPKDYKNISLYDVEIKKDIKEILYNYSWESSAKKLLDVLNRYNAKQ